MALTATELIWLKFCMPHLLITLLCALTLLTNNIGTEALSQNLVLHARTKHIKIEHHFLRDGVVQGALHVDYV